MSQFLQRIAEQLVEKHKSDFREVIVVLPARRSILYFQKALSKQVGKTFWMPETFIMPQFVEWISSAHVVSGFQALTSLYECYRETVDNRAGFDVFCSWAVTALRDFGDIDSSLANSKEVFSNLKNIKEIEGWSFNSENLTESQKHFLLFWEDLGKLYDAYSAYQEKNGRWSYNALAKWTSAQRNLIEEKIKGKQVYFIGMASFSNAELALLDKIKGFAKLEVFWDLDRFYVEDEMHEAGVFGRRYRKSRGESSPLTDNLLTSEKNIRICETTTSIGQCYGAAEFLRQLPREELTETCVVLADEKLAEPLLSALSLPDEPVNLAIGMPLGLTTVARWVASTLRIRQKPNVESRGVYYKDFIEWLQLAKSVGLHENTVARIKNKIISDSLIYITAKDIARQAGDDERVKTISELLLIPELNDLLERLYSVLRNVAGQSKAGVLEKYAATSTAALIDSLIRMTMNYDFLRDIASVHTLWNQMLSGESLQYEGEPVSGLQILGLRETRALDFERLIIVGANEENLPGHAYHQSFIPYELRGHYKLPMPNEQENMTAYIFYRLLQHPSKIDLFYSTISSDFKGTEQSRYITQIENELNAANPKIKIERHQLRLNEGGHLSLNQSVEMNDWIKSRLDSLLEYGISPSAINKFNTCPLDFYYQYILSLGEEDEVEEKISAATFGSIVHLVLERFYGKFKGAYPLEKDYDELSNRVDEELTTAFEEIYSLRNISYGYNFLAMQVAKDMLRRIISYEKKLIKERLEEGIQPKLIDVERTLMRSVATEKYDWNKPVAIRGKADRIEEIAGRVHILDYKTGKVDGKSIKLNKPFTETLSHKDYDKQTQLFSYIYMYSAEGMSPENIRAGFYSFRDHRNGFMMLEDEVTPKKITEFEEAFMNWVKELYQKESFQHNPDSKYCKYCR